MDEQTKNEIIISLNVLGATLTVFYRNAKVLHWLYKDDNFVSVHPWLDDTVATKLNDMVDKTYEQILKLDIPFVAGYTEIVSLSKVEPLLSKNKEGFSSDETFSILLENMNQLRAVIDKNASIAEKCSLYAYHDLMVAMLEDCDQLKYFIKRSL